MELSCPDGLVIALMNFNCVMEFFVLSEEMTLFMYEDVSDIVIAYILPADAFSFIALR